MRPKMHHEVSTISLLRRAREFHKGLCLLATGPAPPAAVTCLLAGHCLEVGLKAYMLKAGWDEERLKKDLGHDLAKAWLTAHEQGLNIAADPPWWCEALSSAHQSPFLARYARLNTGLVVPAIGDLVRDLGALLDKIENEIK